MIRSIGVKNLSKKTIHKIRQMIAAVLAEPELYDQDTFGTAICKTDGGPTCGTTCCAAGWAVFLGSRKLYNEMMAKELAAKGRRFIGWPEAALKALGLEVDAEYNTDRLFGSHHDWPSEFSQAYDEAETPKQKAQIFARRWRAFIQADGQEDDYDFS